MTDLLDIYCRRKSRDYSFDGSVRSDVQDPGDSDTSNPPSLKSHSFELKLPPPLPQLNEGPKLTVPTQDEGREASIPTSYSPGSTPIVLSHLSSTDNISANHKTSSWFGAVQSRPDKSSSKSALTKSLQNRRFPRTTSIGGVADATDDIIITPLPEPADCTVKRYYGPLQLHFVKDSLTSRNELSSDVSVNIFIDEIKAIVRAHVAALGGNALISYRMNLQEPTRKVASRGHSFTLVSITGDVVALQDASARHTALFTSVSSTPVLTRQPSDTTATSATATSESPEVGSGGIGTGGGSGTARGGPAMTTRFSGTSEDLSGKL